MRRCNCNAFARVRDWCHSGNSTGYRDDQVVVRIRTNALRRVAAVAAVALLVSACGKKPEHQLSGQVRTPLPKVGALSLPNAERRPFAFTAAPGHLLLVYFGYTSCPDVCPTTLSDVRATMNRLGGDADKVQVAMVTVDPERDTPEKLQAYVRSFVPTAQALSITDVDALKKVGDAFGAQFSVTKAADGNVEVSHSAFLYAVDDAGRIRVQWPFGVHAPELAGDLAWLLDHPASTNPTEE